MPNSRLESLSLPIICKFIDIDTRRHIQSLAAAGGLQRLHGVYKSSNPRGTIELCETSNYRIIR